MTFAPRAGVADVDAIRPLSTVIVAPRSTPPRPSRARSVTRTTDWAGREDPRTRTQQHTESRISTVSRNTTRHRARSVQELYPGASERIDQQAQTRFAVGITQHEGGGPRAIPADEHALGVQRNPIARGRELGEGASTSHGVRN